MTAPKRILELVELFGRNIESYKGGRYNETQVRREFIDPFFMELGWDVDNRRGYAEAYKDVIHEDAIKVGSATKAPDYCFRIGGTRKFFLEAKNPSVNLKDAPSPAYQLRRYAWSAKLPLSILTDFEELAVYDCRVKPGRTDKASAARVMYLDYTEYPGKWDQIASIFARESVLRGSFDKYAETSKRKKGTAEVDEAFLNEIELWRDSLARNIALRNKLTNRQLNYAVQKTIDRIIFLRICEDRGIERYGELQSLLNGKDIYQRLLVRFRHADDRYNSGLFHFTKEKDRTEGPDELTPGLAIDDKVLKDIFSRLYYPDCPYEFSVLPVEILGHVYEQFLGKVITLSGGHRARIEEKPEVKKAGGVYYTPSYIVDYIVQNTVGKLVESKTPRQVEKLKILDPACGSGSFLLGAYQYLLDWHLKYYMDNESEKWLAKKNPPLAETDGPERSKGGYKLTGAERKRILLNNIYGVDIDPQAVEVTKLSLLLKVLEGERQLVLFHRERALPDLAENIKCGNSLIGTDFFAGQQMTMFDEEQRYKINAFDWQEEFKEIFSGKNPGFDAVIGNPPYGMVNDQISHDYFEKKYKTVEGRFDYFEIFLEIAFELASNKIGQVMFIIPSPFLTNVYSRKLRRYILQNYQIKEITSFSMDVFRDPTVHTCIIGINKTKPSNNPISIHKQITSIEQLFSSYDFIINQTEIAQGPNDSFDIFASPEKRHILKKAEKHSAPLSEICFIRQCIKTGNDKVYVVSSQKKPNENWKPTLKGRSIKRYSAIEKNLWLKYGKWLARNWQNKSFYEVKKIAVRETGKRIIATIDEEKRYFLSSLYSVYMKDPNIALSIYYLLGIINSLFSTWFIKVVALDLTTGAFTKIRTNQFGRLPIRLIDFSEKEEKAQHDKMVSLVESMLDLNKRLQAAKTPDEKRALERQIDSTDRQIDRLVYDLYGLTAEEIKIVEEAANK